MVCRFHTILYYRDPCKFLRFAVVRIVIGLSILGQVLSKQGKSLDRGGEYKCRP